MGACADGLSGDGSCKCPTGANPATACASCLPGYALNGTNACTLCHPSCQTCSAPTSTQCTACYGNAVLGTGQCPCSIGCTCATSCWTCGGPNANQCTSCFPPAVLLPNGTCAATACPAGTYLAPATVRGDACLPCAGACATCNGPLASNCTLCTPPRQLDAATGTCVAQCASGFYALTTNAAACTACAPGCATCVDGVACATCTDANAVLYGGSCLAACPAGTYATALRACAPCMAPCATCTSASTASCATCTSGYSLAPFSGTCVAACPKSYYSLDGVCTLCDSSCATCNGPTAADCTSCAAQFLEEGRCVGSCHAGYAVNNFFFCDACSGLLSGCAACTTSYACTACANPALVVTSGVGGICASSCAPHTALAALPSRVCVAYACASGQFDTGTGCAPCDAACQTCTGPTGADCATYACDAACGNCDGPTAANCTTCPDCRQTSACLFDDGRCVSACPAAFYQTANLCYPCSSACATCAGPGPSACTSCPAGTGLPFVLNGTCVAVCPPDYTAAGPICVLTGNIRALRIRGRPGTW